MGLQIQSLSFPRQVNKHRARPGVERETGMPKERDSLFQAGTFKNVINNRACVQRRAGSGNWVYEEWWKGLKVQSPFQREGLSPPACSPPGSIRKARKCCFNWLVLYTAGQRNPQKVLQGGGTCPVSRGSAQGRSRSSYLCISVILPQGLKQKKCLFHIETNSL